MWFFLVLVALLLLHGASKASTAQPGPTALPLPPPSGRAATTITPDIVRDEWTTVTATATVNGVTDEQFEQALAIYRRL